MGVAVTVYTALSGRARRPFRPVPFCEAVAFRAGQITGSGRRQVGGSGLRSAADEQAPAGQMSPAGVTPGRRGRRPRPGAGEAGLSAR